MPEPPTGWGGQVEDGGETGLQPPPPGPDVVLVLVADDQGSQPATAGDAPSHEQAPARAAGCGQAAKESHGAGGCPGDAEVAVKQQGGADRRQRAGEGVRVEPVAKPQRPGEAKDHRRPVQPDRGQTAGL
jgi:hypothetical protein